MDYLWYAFYKTYPVFQEKLKDKDSVYPSGMFDTNKDNALLSDGTDIVNTVGNTYTVSRTSLTVEKSGTATVKRFARVYQESHCCAMERNMIPVK